MTTREIVAALAWFETIEKLPSGLTEKLAALKAEFPPAAIGKLPKLTCRSCSKGDCQQHEKKKCNDCDNWISPAHIHLDYVGHAEVTDRLLSIDPLWTWEPFSLDVQRLPALDLDSQGRPVGFWIRLTVCGITRPGYGSVTAGSFDSVKQLIGDALRNAAMRFGVALDLWSKNELESALTEERDPDRSSPAPARSRSRSSKPPAEPQHPDDGTEDGKKACSICGSTRTKLVDVRGTVRCQNGTECKKRAEAGGEQPAGDAQRPGDGSEAAAAPKRTDDAGSAGSGESEPSQTTLDALLAEFDALDEETQSRIMEALDTAGLAFNDEQVAAVEKIMRDMLAEPFA